MQRDPGALFISFSIEKLNQLASRLVDCLVRLTEEQIWTRHGPHANAVGNLVLHLCGNVRQWIGFGVAGLPDIRQRPEEFRAESGSRGELTKRLQAVVEEACGILRSLPVSRLSESTRVQGYEVSVLQAIYHVVEHFAQHTGQVTFATKALTGADLGYYRHLDPTPAKEQTSGADSTP